MRATLKRAVGFSALAFAGVAAVSCRAADGETDGSQAVSDLVRVVNVEVLTVQPSSFTEYVRVTGEVEALNDVVVSAEEGGVIREFYVEKGSAVERGQAVAKIDDAVLAAQVREARAAAQLAREQYERQRAVWEESRVGSEIALLQARSQAEAAAARLAALEARLEKTVIRSPVKGILDERYLEAGEMAAPGAPLVRVVAAHKLKITAGVPERFAPDIRPGAEARVTFDVLPGRVFAAAVGFVGASVDSRSRTFPVEVLLDNPDGVIKPRMVANLQIVRRKLEQVIAIPQSAVTRTENGYQVFVAEERDGVLYARGRPVSLGPSHEDLVVIAEGLVPGERVITVGSRLVDEGTRIRIVGNGEVNR
ncbi:MAG: RND transporter [Gemmatimonadales bacterium]|nr:MAG: RND transporter [Gemmatimonadales bacterium]